MQLTNEVATANQTVLRTVLRSLFGNRSNDVQRAEARQQPPPAAARASTRLRAALSRSHAAPPRVVKDARKDNTPQSGEEEKLQVEAVTGADAPAKSSHPMSVRRDVVSGNVAAEDRASISGDTVGDNGCSTPADGSGEHEEQSDIDEGDDASAATGEQSDHEFENHDGSDSDVDGYPESPDGRSFSAPAASPLSLEESSPAEEMVPLATLEAVKRSHAHEVRQLQSEVERMSRIFRDGKHELLALQEKHQYLQAMYGASAHVVLVPCVEVTCGAAGTSGCRTLTHSQQRRAPCVRSWASTTTVRLHSCCGMTVPLHFGKLRATPKLRAPTFGCLRRRKPTLSCRPKHKSLRA